MRRSTLFRAGVVGGVAVLAAAALLTGSSTAAPPAGESAGPGTAAVTAPRTALTVTGTAGEPVVGARTYTETALLVSSTGDSTYRSFLIQTPGVTWTLALSAPEGQQLAPGQYRNADRGGSGRLPGFEIRSSATSCPAAVHGSYDIQQLTFDAAGAVSAIEVSFVQRCGSATAPALRGTLWWRVTPLTFRYSAESGEYLTGGGSGSYTGATTLFGVRNDLTSQEYTVDGPRNSWFVGLTPPTGQTQLQVGTFPVSAYGGAGTAGLRITRRTEQAYRAGCDTPTGTLTVREVAYTGAVLSALDASFVYRCQGTGPALRGTIQHHAGAFPALPPST